MERFRLWWGSLCVLDVFIDINFWEEGCVLDKFGVCKYDLVEYVFGFRFFDVFFGDKDDVCIDEFFDFFFFQDFFECIDIFFVYLVGVLNDDGVQCVIFDEVLEVCVVVEVNGDDFVGFVGLYDSVVYVDGSWFIGVENVFQV